LLDEIVSEESGDRSKCERILAIIEHPGRFGQGDASNESSLF
jgi:hypothetical protein